MCFCRCLVRGLVVYLVLAATVLLVLNWGLWIEFRVEAFGIKL